MEKLLDENKIHHGHRSRMRTKLVTHGSGIFDTYEVLEMLLYYVIPYRDTNPIAKQLLRAFGSLDGVLSADKEELMSISGIGERAADFITRAGSLDSILGVNIDSDNSRVINSYTQAGKYFSDYFADAQKPQAAVMLLDNKMRRIDTVRMEGYEFGSAKTVPRPFIDAVIRSRASVVITAHCNPHGAIFPTEADRATNKLIAAALKAIGAVHIEHYVISGDGYIGMINNLSGKFAAYAEINRFIRTKNEAIALGIVKDPADYMPDYYSTVFD